MAKKNKGGESPYQFDVVWEVRRQEGREEDGIDQSDDAELQFTVTATQASATYFAGRVRLVVKLNENTESQLEDPRLGDEFSTLR